MTNKEIDLVVYNNGLLKIFNLIRIIEKKSDNNPYYYNKDPNYKLYLGVIKKAKLSYNQVKNSYYRHYGKIKRAKRKIEKILDTEETCLFLTLTFDNNYIEKLKNKRRSVREYLKTISKNFIANVDYGEKNGRLHYHAIIRGRIESNTWKYGAINFKVINNKCSGALSKYILKLARHSLKTTTKAEKIIYSR